MVSRYNVKIIRRGDSSLELNQVLDLDTYLEIVKLVIINGGEIPIAILDSSKEDVECKV